MDDRMLLSLGTVQLAGRENTAGYFTLYIEDNLVWLELT